MYAEHCHVSSVEDMMLWCLQLLNHLVHIGVNVAEGGDIVHCAVNNHQWSRAKLGYSILEKQEEWIGAHFGIRQSNHLLYI